MNKDKYMMKAIDEARKGSNKGDGGPFGAVIVLDGKIISYAHNEVLSSKDPTAHAEILAIRRASLELGRFDLSDCELYTSCEPCPMCFAAVHWSGIKKVYYGCTRYDAEKIGFDDDLIYRILRTGKIEGDLKLISFERDKCLSVFDEWEQKKDKVIY